MKLILAFDNDNAGYNAVWRTLVNHVKTMSFPPFTEHEIKEMSIDIYLQYIKQLSPIQMELEQERLDQNPDPLKQSYFDIQVEYYISAYKALEPLRKYLNV